MSKRRLKAWDGDSFEFPKAGNQAHSPVNELYDDDDPITEGEVLDEAHEALSKLFNKTNKRAKQLRGVRRKDAWH